MAKAIESYDIKVHGVDFMIFRALITGTKPLKLSGKSIVIPIEKKEEDNE